MLLLAAAEVTLWPDATPTPYTTKLGDAVGALARCLDAVADMWSGRPEGRERFAAALPEATDAAEALRPSRLPPGQRPASAGRRDRALASAAGSARLLLGRTVDLSLVDDHCAVTLPAAAALLRQTASCADAAAAWLRGRGRRRCPTPTGSRPRSSSSAPPATPRRPTACRPSGCSWARSR